MGVLRWNLALDFGLCHWRFELSSCCRRRHPKCPSWPATPAGQQPGCLRHLSAEARVTPGFRRLLSFRPTRLQCCQRGHLTAKLYLSLAEALALAREWPPSSVYTEGAFTRLDPSGQMINEAVKAIPTGRLGEVEEISNLATYLCSDYASWLNAETVTFDGGEFRSLAGEFNQLRKVPKEMWDMMEQMIRSSNKKQKSKGSDDSKL